MPIPNIANASIINHALLSDFTTFKLGGPCRYLIECATPTALQSTVKTLDQSNTPFILLGGGSNVVASDTGVNCVVIRYVSKSPLITLNGYHMTVSASTYLDDAAIYTVENGLDGLVFTSGIPGTLGGAIVGNAGAWGKQIGDIISSATIINNMGELKTVGPDYFEFSYRNSKLKETDEIITEATLILKPGDPIQLAIERSNILKERAEKHPNLTIEPCAGSFFRNIEPTSKAEKRQAVGWFLEQSGGKELRAGGAYIFNKHANIIIKGEHCTADDVYDLHLKMIEAVRTKFGFTIGREVRFLGRFQHASASNAQLFW